MPPPIRPTASRIHHSSFIIRHSLAALASVALAACAASWANRQPPASSNTPMQKVSDGASTRLPQAAAGLQLAAAVSPGATLKAPIFVPAPPPATPTADGYTLVWHDEFDHDGPLNPADWGYETGFVRNQENQYYQADNATCKDGFLIITARKESKPNPRYINPVATTTSAPARGGGGGRGRPTSNAWPNLPTIDITAASVNTSGHHQWTYGRFEIRAKIDTRAGSWPAFWTLGTAGGWPANGEIDIMEYYRNMVLANVAWQSASGGATWSSVRLPLASFPPNWSDQFHTWRMDWDAKSIQLFLDDKKVNEQDLAKTINAGGGGGRGGAAAGVNPFVDKPLYIMLNQAIGGQNGGDYSRTTFPILFIVDYVRVWQRAPQAPKPGGNE